jgi:hypothetical protein
VAKISTTGALSIFTGCKASSPGQIEDFKQVMRDIESLSIAFMPLKISPALRACPSAC